MYKDDLILGWIKVNVSAPIQPHVISYSTTLEAWTMLEREWSPTDPTHKQTLRNEMKALKKTSDIFMKEYILKFKGLRYSLEAIGYRCLTNEMIIEMVLDGLTPECRMFMSTLHDKELKFQKIVDLLIVEEILINKLDSDEISANYANSSFRGGRGYKIFKGGRSNQNNSGRG